MRVLLENRVWFLVKFNWKICEAKNKILCHIGGTKSSMKVQISIKISFLYAYNLSKYVYVSNTKIFSISNHDCHILF